MAIGYGVECQKPTPRKKVKRREERLKSEKDAKVREYCMGRERGICRCCRLRDAESRHELRFRSLGGKVSKQNCVMVCGDGVNGCHGHLQGHRITYGFEDESLGAQSTVIFTPKGSRAAEWMRIAVGQQIVSPVMRVIEEE